MNWEGNSLIDCDDGSDSRSHKYNGDMNINVEIKEYLLDLEKNMWMYNQTYPLDEISVSTENLKQWISDNGNSAENYPITVIKNHADEVVISQRLENGEEVKFEMTYV